jgi:nucleoside-diphosphate-sugar epimerase
MKSVLVTGGAGFIATNLCSSLLDEGHQVFAIDNFITSTRANTNTLRDNNNFVFIHHDIVKPMPKLIKEQEIDFIYHLACPTGVPNLIPLAEEMITTSSIGTRNVMELAKEKNAKVLFTSSSEVYGDPEVFPQTESYTGNVDADGIRSPYEEGKRFAETIIMMYVRKYKIDAKIVRIFNTYGPMMTLSDTRVIPNFLDKAFHGKPLPVQGEGKQKRTFCYVDDLVDGLMLVMQSGEKGNVYNAGSDVEITISALAKKILQLTGSKSGIERTERPSHDHKRRMPDLSKIQALGWRQSTDLDEGLRRTIEWYKTVI